MRCRPPGDIVPGDIVFRSAVRSAAAILAALALIASAAASSGQANTRTATPRLTDSFAMKLIVQKETNGLYRAGTHLAGLSWLFAPACNQGPCSVQLSSTPGACVSGQCGQWPLGYLWSDEPLIYSDGIWHGAFTVKQGCSTSSFSDPYAYEQRTTVKLHATASHTYGPGETQATRIAGTVTFSGAANSAERRKGCLPYSLTFAVTGTGIA
jgi:hypothetical protein